MTTQQMTSQYDNPWIGLDSYHEGQTLYGRSREIQELAMAIFYQRQTIVYGQSGIGKSSILHAGIFPEARRRGCLPISIRFEHYGKTNYRDQFTQCVTDAIQAAGGELIDHNPQATAPQSLWEFFHRYKAVHNGHTITPLIVIDQFEEIFTLNRDEQEVRSFFSDLADLFNDIIPSYLTEAKKEKNKDNPSNIFNESRLNTPYDYLAEEMPYHLVFVLREDYLSYLERYSRRIPALKQNRFSLLPLTYNQAVEIITRPRIGLISLDVADAIIRHIVTSDEINEDTYVDAALLSLFMSRL